jgi:predicted nucleic acid-binding protein
LLPSTDRRRKRSHDWRRSVGKSARSIAQLDAQIAGIVQSRGATLATRNIADFNGCGIQVVDPWRV